MTEHSDPTPEPEEQPYEGEPDFDGPTADGEAQDDLADTSIDDGGEEQ